MNYSIISEEEWDSLKTNFSARETEAIRNIELAWERMAKGGLSSYQRRFMGEILKYQATKVETEEARRYLNRRYNKRFRQPPLLPYGETCDER